MTDRPTHPDAAVIDDWIRTYGGEKLSTMQETLADLLAMVRAEERAACSRQTAAMRAHEADEAIRPALLALDRLRGKARGDVAPERHNDEAIDRDVQLVASMLRALQRGRA